MAMAVVSWPICCIRLFNSFLVTVSSVYFVSIFTALVGKLLCCAVSDSYSGQYESMSSASECLDTISKNFSVESIGYGTSGHTLERREGIRPLKR